MTLLKLMVISSIISMTYWRKNIINMLLSLEMMFLSLIFLFLFLNHLSNSFFILFFLAMMVSSSSLGLSLLVSFSRHMKKNNSSLLSIY